MTARVPYVLAWDELKLLQRLGWELVWDDRGSTMYHTRDVVALFRGVAGHNVDEDEVCAVV